MLVKNSIFKLFLVFAIYIVNQSISAAMAFSFNPSEVHTEEYRPRLTRDQIIDVVDNNGSLAGLNRQKSLVKA